MRTALWDLTVLPQKLPNINDQEKKVWTRQVCITYLFSTVPASGTFHKKCGSVCLFSNLGAFFSPETMYVFSNCRNISRWLQQLSNVQRASSFCLCGIYTHSLHLLSLFVPNPPFLCYPDFQSYLIHLLKYVFSEPRSSDMHPYSWCGSHSLPLIVLVTLLWLSSSAVFFKQRGARPAHNIQDASCYLLTSHFVLQGLLLLSLTDHLL